MAINTNVMTNSEKKQFILDIHRLLVSIRPCDKKFSLSQMKEKEDLMWEQFKNVFLVKQPESLFKYRKAKLNIFGSKIITTKL